MDNTQPETLQHFDEPLAFFIEAARGEYWYNLNDVTPTFKVSWQQYPTFAMYLAAKIRAVGALMEMGITPRGIAHPRP